MHDVQEINDFEQLFARRELWDAMLSQTPSATFFHTLDWLQVYWKHFGAGQRLRALVVSAADGPVGILPLVVRDEHRKIGRIRVLTYPLDDWGSFYGPLGSAPELTLLEGLRHIRRTRRDWDAVEMRWIERRSPLDEATFDAMRQVGWQTYRRQRQQTAVVHIRGTWDEYQKSWSSKQRNNFRRYERRLAERGQITFESHRPSGAISGDADPRWDLYEACETIARQSWQGESENGTTLTHDSVRAILRDVHQTAAAVGGLDMHVMFLDGQPLAFAYNYYWRGSVFGLRIGFDASLSRDGVGNLLSAHAIKRSFDAGDHTYDMGPGSLDYKRFFASGIVPIVQYNHYHPLAPRAQALRLKHCTEQWWLPSEATEASS